MRFRRSDVRRRDTAARAALRSPPLRKTRSRGGLAPGVLALAIVAGRAFA